jgi:hypothetical protein
MQNKIEHLLNNITLQDLEKYDLDIPINEKQHYVPVIYLK